MLPYEQDTIIIYKLNMWSNFLVQIQEFEFGLQWETKGIIFFHWLDNEWLHEYHARKEICNDHVLIVSNFVTYALPYLQSLVLTRRI